MSRSRYLLLLAAVLSASACGTSAGDDLEGEALGSTGAHEHGIARLDLAVDGTVVTAELAMPGISAYGFEHEPVTEEDRKAVAWATQVIESRFAEMVVFDPAFGCKVSRATVAVAEEPEHGDEHDNDEEHAGLKAHVVFRCDRDPTGSKAALAFGELFPGVERIDLQLISAERQTGRRVRAEGTRFKL